MQINIQPIQKPDIGDGATLSVHSIFHTIQGEGPFTGYPAIFVRLAGCNLACPGCDTIYTGDDVRMLSVEAIQASVRKLHQGPRLVVITGGEPFRQNITPLCLALLDEDYYVQIESNGTLAPPPGFPASTVSFMCQPGAWIIVSPKAGKVHPKTAALAVAWKYVLSADSVNHDDGLPILALDHTAKPHVARPPKDFPKERIYLQPMDAKDKDINHKNLHAVIQSCMKWGYTLQTQLHKTLSME